MSGRHSAPPRLIYARREFWEGLLERAGKTAGQAAAASLTVTATGVVEVAGLDWLGLGAVVALTVLYSVATSFARPYFTAGLPDPRLEHAVEVGVEAGVEAGLEVAAPDPPDDGRISSR